MHVARHYNPCQNMTVVAALSRDNHLAALFAAVFAALFSDAAFFSEARRSSVYWRMRSFEDMTSPPAALSKYFSRISSPICSARVAALSTWAMFT
mmetsp:Transcript_44741/g.103491  ORF Transcript_44741/g.103491 Transcript_44741/m.103491 type:complete len:95 (+) Transcript_44741:180-464(+)